MEMGADTSSANAIWQEYSKPVRYMLSDGAHINIDRIGPKGNGLEYKARAVVEQWALVVIRLVMVVSGSPV